MTERVISMSSPKAEAEPVSRRESGFHDWFFAVTLTLYFEADEKVLESTVASGLDLETHVRDVLDAAESKRLTLPTVVSAALSVQLRLSREPATTPALNLPEDVIRRLAEIRATVDIDSYLVEPERVLPARLRANGGR